MVDDKVEAAKLAAGVLTPKSGWGSISGAVFSVEQRASLAAIAMKAGGNPEAINRLVDAAQFAVIRASLSAQEPVAQRDAEEQIRAFMAAARKLIDAWQGLEPALRSAIIEHAKPVASVPYDLGETSAALSGAVFVDHLLKESSAHRPQEYALCDALCRAWVDAGLWPGFSRGTDEANQKKECLFEQFAGKAAEAIGSKIGPGIFAETIKRQKSRLPPG